MAIKDSGKVRDSQDVVYREEIQQRFFESINQGTNKRSSTRCWSPFVTNREVHCS